MKILDSWDQTFIHIKNCYCNLRDDLVIQWNDTVSALGWKVDKSTTIPVGDGLAGG